MSSILACVATVLVGIDVGYQPLPHGGAEYIVQIEPGTLESLKPGEDLESYLPPEARDVHPQRIRVVISAQKPPKELPPKAVEKTPAPPQPFVPQKKKPAAPVPTTAPDKESLPPLWPAPKEKNPAVPARSAPQDKKPSPPLPFMPQEKTRGVAPPSAFPATKPAVRDEKGDEKKVAARTTVEGNKLPAKAPQPPVDQPPSTAPARPAPRSLGQGLPPFMRPWEGKSSSARPATMPTVPPTMTSTAVIATPSTTASSSTTSSAVIAPPSAASAVAPAREPIALPAAAASPVALQPHSGLPAVLSTASPPPAAPAAASPVAAAPSQPYRPWTLLWVVALGLCGSITGNLYLGWVFWDVRGRYQAALSHTPAME